MSLRKMQTTSQSDRISVIVPVYNVERWVTEAVDSILAQTYDNLEVLLIDDGSNDGSGWICDRYAEADSRVRVFHTANKGLSAARNLGLSEASGEYIFFLDADDSVRPDLLQLMHDRAVSENADITVCGMQLVDESGAEIGRLNGAGLPAKRERVGGEEFLRMSMENLLSVCVPLRLYKRDVVTAIHFPNGRFFEDVAVLGALAAKVKVVAFEPKAVYLHRRRAGSITADMDMEKIRDIRSSVLRCARDAKAAFPHMSGEIRWWVLNRHIALAKNLAMVPKEKQDAEYRAYREKICGMIRSHMPEYRARSLRVALTAEIVCRAPSLCRLYGRTKRHFPGVTAVRKLFGMP